MKTLSQRRALKGLFICSLSASVLPSVAEVSAAQFSPELRVTKFGGSGTFQIRWQNFSKAPGESLGGTFEVQASADLVNWWPVDDRISSARLDPGAPIEIWLPASEKKLFYRVLSVPAREQSSLGSSGAETLGFAEMFETTLEDIGEIGPSELAELYPSGANYLPEIGWDPTTAQYWELFSLDIQQHNTGKSFEDPDYRSVDYRLNDQELAMFRKNGFVVSERLGTGSFGDAFYKLWKNDLPVYVSSDAILQAWHRSYDMMLAEIETAFLSQALSQVLATMHAHLEPMREEIGDGVLKDSVADADYFLAVARSLLWSQTILDRDNRATQTLQWIKDAKLTLVPDLFGTCRQVDFSQFVPRGHYTDSADLRKYFQAMMWCSRIDLRVAGGPFDDCGWGSKMASPREMGTAIVLWDLLNRSGQYSTWAAMDRVITALVGWTDSMTFAQLGGVLAGAGPRSVSQIQDWKTLERIQGELLDGTLGLQNIRSDVYFNAFGDQRGGLPRSFTFLGQRFTPDSWVMGKSVYSEIHYGGIPVERRVPSALDVAFSVFGNSQITPELEARISRVDARNSSDHTVRFRDGFPYQHNLAAARSVIDQLGANAWSENVYMGWLDALRTLSDPTTDPRYPAAMRTRAWALKTLNTQMASWTQLRHDNILYAKQSYTDTPICFYPAGYVEPRPAFWERMERLARETANLISGLSYDGSILTPGPNVFFPVTSIPASAAKRKQIEFLDKFADTMATLRSLAAKELAREPFNEDDQLFIRNLIEQVGWDPWGSGSVRRYGGWYPVLFYHPWAVPDTEAFDFYYGADRWDLVVADVHTDPPCADCGDEGGVLHQAVGNVHLLMMAVDCGEDRAVYAGPVFSYYEFETLGPDLTRLTDTDWELRWESAGWWNGQAPPSQFADFSRLPPHPEWTRAFLVQHPSRN